MGNVGYVYEYDVMGNITQIKEGTRKAGTDTTIENAVVKVQYEYDSDGMRTSKTVGGVKTKYYYSDGKLLYEATKKVLEASISIYKDNPRMLGAALYTIPRG